MSAMARLLVPAVGLMNRLRYPQKFLLISLLFAVPLGLMMFLWLTQIGEQLAFARQERMGLRYANGLAQVFEPYGDDVAGLRAAAEGCEIFSLVRQSDLDPGGYLDTFFDTGREQQHVI